MSTPGVDRSDPLRVLHVTSSLDGGGAQRVLLTVLNGLPGVSQCVALGGAGELLSLVSPAVEVRPAFSEGELADLIVRFRPDVIQTWLGNSLLMSAMPAAYFGVPFVHRVYNVPSVQPATGAHWHGLMSRALSAAARVIALSATAADDAARFYEIERPDVVYNGFPLAGARQTGGAPLPKGAGRFVILAVGRLAIEKNHACLIDAVSRIAPSHPDVELWIAGTGPLEMDLRQHAKRAGIGDRVNFLGFREDVTALHAAADVFVCPSVTEGFGNALVEALAAGLPVVASDLAVVRREILAGEPAAALFPSGDAHALATVLDQLIRHPEERRAMGARAHTVAGRFGVTRMLSEFLAIYRQVGEESRAIA